MHISSLSSLPFPVLRSWWMQSRNFEIGSWLAVRAPVNSMPSSSRRDQASRDGTRSARPDYYCAEERPVLLDRVVGCGGKRGSIDNAFSYTSLCLFVFPSFQKQKQKRGGEKRERERRWDGKKKKKTSVAFVLSFHALESSIILSSAYLLLFFCLVSDLSFLPSLLQEGTLARAYLFASLCYQAAHSGLLPAPFALNLSHRKNSLNCIYRNQERKKTLRRSTKQVSIRHRTSSIYLTCYIWHTQVWNQNENIRTVHIQNLLITVS
jgi:hypothetical protein